MLIDGNQQATEAGASESRRDYTINWLNQVFEKEAKYDIVENWKKLPTPIILITTTNQELILKIKNSFLELDLAVHFKDFDRGQKPYTKITILGIKRCLQLVSLIKNRKSELIKRFCLERLAVPVKTPYTNWQKFQLKNQLNQLHSV